MSVRVSEVQHDGASDSVASSVAAQSQAERVTDSQLISQPDSTVACEHATVSKLERTVPSQFTPARAVGSRRVSSAPIPVHVTATLFDTPSQAEQIDNKPFLVRVGRRVLTSIAGMWMRLAGRVARRAGWFPSIEPYIGYGTHRYARLICRTVYAPKLGHHSALKRGIYAMLVVPAVRVRVALSIDNLPVETVQIGDSEVYDRLEESRDSSAEYCISDCAGYLDLITERALSPGRHVVSYKVHDREPVKASLFAIDKHVPIGIISDVDDTIMITQAPSPIRAAYNLLIMNPAHRSPVPGMAEFFRSLEQLREDVPFFYLSTSPWNVEASIRHFIEREKFPEGPLLLRDLDPRPKTFIPNGPQHKLEFATQLMDDFPGMRFVLLGDDGQKDPSTYANIIRQHPGRVLAVGIRQLHKDSTVDDFRSKMSRDFAVALSASCRAYIATDAHTPEVPTVAFEKFGSNTSSIEHVGDIGNDSGDSSMRVIEAKGAAGTLQGVPFFAAPQGQGLAQVMLPFIQEAISKQ